MKSLLVAPLLALLLSWTGVRPADSPAGRRLDAGNAPAHLVPAGQSVAQVPEPGGQAQLGVKGDVSSSRALPAPSARDSRAVVGRVRARLLSADGAVRQGSDPPLYFASLPPPR